MNLNSLMTGQLVAFFKQRHDEMYREEYIRRLTAIGFTAIQAENMFMFELMSLKFDSIGLLTDPNYIRDNYFSLESKILWQPAEYYVEHQIFLLSEVTKLWDEAEYHYQSGRKEGVPDDVWTEIEQLTRYKGGQLFVETLTSIAEHTKTDINLIRKYAMAEQQLLFKYKWNPYGNEASPYGDVGYDDDASFSGTDSNGARANRSSVYNPDGDDIIDDGTSVDKYSSSDIPIYSDYDDTAAAGLGKSRGSKPNFLSNVFGKKKR